MGLKLFKFSLIIGGFGLFIAFFVSLIYSRNLPDVDTISTYIPAETTKIYSSDGVILAELHQEEKIEYEFQLSTFLRRFKIPLLQWKIPTFINTMALILKELCVHYIEILLPWHLLRADQH